MDNQQTFKEYLIRMYNHSYYTAYKAIKAECILKASFGFDRTSFTVGNFSLANQLEETLTKEGISVRVVNYVDGSYRLNLHWELTKV